MKAPEKVSWENCVLPRAGLRPRLAGLSWFRSRLFLLAIVLSAAVALIPNRPSAVRAVTCPTNSVVANNLDSGPESLRQAIMDACDGDTITFGNTVTSPITLTTADLVINKNLTINGPGANLLTVERSTASGTPQFRIFTILSGTVTISGLTVTNGHAPDGASGGSGDGGGGSSGGGISNAGTLTLTNSTIRGNSTGSGGSGKGQGGNGGNGGGINNSGTLTLSGATVSGNSTGSGGIAKADPGSGGFGGGIFNEGTLTLINSTISGNSTGAGGFGASGGPGGFAGDTGGIYNLEATSIRASIIAGNSALGVKPDVNGTFTSEGFNVIGKADGSTGFTQMSDQTGTAASPLDAKLGPLQNNGGPTFTHALLPGSPAIENGDDSVLGAPLFLTFDQRGPEFARKVGSRVDIGAFEFGAAMCPTITATVSGGGTIASGGSSAVTVTVTGGVPPYTVTLTNGSGTMTGPSPLTFTVHPSMNTTYSVASGTDLYGCPVSGMGMATVTVLDVCLKDNRTGNLLQWNSTTGQYKFTRCSDGFTITGMGVAKLVNGIQTLTDFKSNIRLSAGFNTGQLTGNATIYLQVVQGVWQTFQVVDTNPHAVCACPVW